MKKKGYINWHTFLVSMVLGLIVIFGEVGFLIIDSSGLGGVTQASINAGNEVQKDQNQLGGMQKTINSYMKYRQKLWIADNPTVRVGRQLFYVAAVFVKQRENFPQSYGEINQLQLEQIISN